MSSSPPARPERDPNGSAIDVAASPETSTDDLPTDDDLLSELLMDFAGEDAVEETPPDVGQPVAFEPLDDASEEDTQETVGPSAWLDALEGIPADDPQEDGEGHEEAFSDGTVVLPPEESDDVADRAPDLSWFAPNLPALEEPVLEQGNTAMVAPLTTFEEDGAAPPWSERYEARTLAPAPGLKCLGFHAGEVVLLGERVATLRGDALLYLDAAVPNPINSVASTARGLVAVPAGPQLYRWTRGGRIATEIWPVHGARGATGRPPRVSSSGDRVRLIVPGELVAESSNGGETWTQAPLKGVAAVSGDAPAFGVTEGSTGLQLWLRSYPEDEWRMLPVQVPESQAAADAPLFLVTGAGFIALSAAPSGLVLSVDGGLSFRSIPGCRHLSGLVLGQSAQGERLFGVQTRPGSEAMTVLALDPLSGEVARVAEFSGVRGEEPSVSDVLWQPQPGRLLVLGSFGLVAVTPP